MTYLDTVFIPSRNRVFKVILKKYPWIGYIATKVSSDKIIFGVQVIEEKEIIEEWTLTEENTIITNWEKGIKNLNYKLLGIQINLIVSIDKRVLENWVAEEERLLKHPLLNSLKYAPTLFIGAKIYKKYTVNK